MKMSSMAFRGLFALDFGSPVIGYTFSETWNGWACPCFGKAEADQIMAMINDANRELFGDHCMSYDTHRDAYVYINPDFPNEEPEIFAGEDIDTVDGPQHVYPIGAWAWTWQQVD